MSDRSSITDADLNLAIRAGDAWAAELPEGDVAPVVSAGAAVALPAPVPVVWAEAPPPDDAAVVSVGEPGILAAPGGSGKSYLALDVALAAVSGVSPAAACGLAVRPGPVLLVNYEDGPARLGARLRALAGRTDAAPADLDRLSIVADPAPLWAPLDGTGAVPAVAFGALARRVELDRPSLVIVDPLGAAAAAVNPNDGSSARACMRSLAALSAATGAGVLVVAHDTKAARREARDTGSLGAGAVAGSGQWHDAARGVVYLHSSAAGRVLEAVKVNHGRSGWGVRLAEVGGADGVPFRGFERAGAVMGPEAMEVWRADGRKAAATGPDPEADWCSGVTRSGKRCMQTAVRDGLCQVHWRARKSEAAAVAETV